MSRHSAVSSSLPGVMGSSRMRLPVASNTALATAAATPVADSFPIPLAPSGPRSVELVDEGDVDGRRDVRVDGQRNEAAPGVRGDDAHVRGPDAEGGRQDRLHPRRRAVRSHTPSASRSAPCGTTSAIGCTPAVSRTPEISIRSPRPAGQAASCNAVTSAGADLIHAARAQAVPGRGKGRRRKYRPASSQPGTAPRPPMISACTAGCGRARRVPPRGASSGPTRRRGRSLRRSPGR